MKALTLTQPWATLVALGAKRIETRSWSTPYRGTLAIHAAKGFPRWAKDACLEPEFAIELGSDVLPTGAVIATCRLISCLPTRELGRWAWLLADVKLLPVPIPAKGALGLWDWNDDALWAGENSVEKTGA